MITSTQQPRYKNIYSNIRILFDWFIRIFNVPAKPPATKKSNISPEASQHWKIFGVVAVKFQLKPRTLPDLWTTFSHPNHPYKFAGFAGIAGKCAGFLIKTYRNIRKLHFLSAGTLREFAGKCGKSGKPYKTIYKHKDINTHTKTRIIRRIT